ncbi:19087_t:CDS:2, partial [Gigaspora margarita]
THLEDLCKEKGVRLEFLSVYSPDFNPIEQTFFYIKNYLRQNKIWAESMPNPLGILDLTCIMINKTLAYACYQHSDVEVELTIEAEIESTINVEVELTIGVK